MESSLCLRICMLILLVQYPTCFSLINNNNHLCREDERHLLLQLKQQLPSAYPEEYYKTKYWKGSSDCCQWDGVTCNNFTGHVTGLDLSYNRFSTVTYLTGQLNSSSSLFHLTHLRSLNIAYNNFNGSTLPAGFARLIALRHLNLSEAEFKGQIPMEFYQLSNLLSLDLAGVPGSDNKLRFDIKMLFGNMTRLRVLVLADQDLSEAEVPINISSFLTRLDLANTGLQGNLPATVFEKPNLQFISLKGNAGLKVSLPKSFNWSTVHSIKSLDLAGTNISGTLPDSISFLSSLNYLGFSGCKLWGPIPESIGNLTAITFMDLSNNEFSGRLPSKISNLTRLSFLDLSWNHLEGEIPDAFSGFQDMTDLALSYNFLEGRIPSSLTNMSRLTSLSFSSNALTGPFPSRTGHGLQQLTYMDFSYNYIQGIIPSWLLSLPSLEMLYMSSNRLTGQFGNFNSRALSRLDLSSNRLNIELQSFYSLTSINALLISHNTVAGHDVNVAFPNLYRLEMSSCEIKDFPNFLRSHMPNLDYLDLSNNKIHDPIPTWFTSNPLQSLQHLNLSHNSIHGSIPPALGQMTNLEQLDLSSNQFRGGIPQNLTNLTFLVALNLSHNHLVGPIPQGKQFLTFSNDSYAGNSGLCGAPLTRSCGQENLKR